MPLNRDKVVVTKGLRRPFQINGEMLIFILPVKYMTNVMQLVDIHRNFVIRGF